MEIKKLKFIKEKYGRELLLDCSLYSEQDISLHNTPFILDFYGIYFITKGNGHIFWDNISIEFKEGYLLFFQPGQIRKWTNVSNNFDGFFLVFEREFIETFFQDLFFIHRFQFFYPHHAGYMKSIPEFFNQLIGLCKKINKELLILQNDSHHLLRSVLYQMLIEINREYCKTFNLPLELFQDSTTLQFLQLLNRYVRKYHKVDDYTRLMNISRSQLNIIIKKSTGQTVSKLIKERMISEIKQELLYTNKSIKEICFEMNFNNESNFNRFFKKETRLNPSLYREHKPK